MLHALRGELGTDVFFDWLHQYADSAAGQVATPDMFWSLLTPEQLQATLRTRQEYLRQPQIVYLRDS
jgi:aminopeptidase N